MKPVSVSPWLKQHIKPWRLRLILNCTSLFGGTTFGYPLGSPDGDDDYPLDESPRNDNDNEFEESMLHNRNQMNLTGKKVFCVVNKLERLSLIKKLGTDLPKSNNVVCLQSSIVVILHSLSLTAMYDKLGCLSF